jgi:hypothetical protein
MIALKGGNSNICPDEHLISGSSICKNFLPGKKEKVYRYVNIQMHYIHLREARNRSQCTMHNTYIFYRRAKYDIITLLIIN